MKNPVPFRQAMDQAKELGLSRRTRLIYDEIYTLTRLLYNYESYLEVGVYDGLSAYLVATTTKVTRIGLVDIHPNRTIVDILQKLNMFVYPYWHDIREWGHEKSAINNDHYGWCLLDADHSYEATRDAYRMVNRRCGTVVLHDVEMEGPGRLFNEIGGVKIVSNGTFYSPDKKKLCNLGYGILKPQEPVTFEDVNV